MEKKFSAAQRRIHAVINLAILGTPGKKNNAFQSTILSGRPRGGAGRPGDIARWPLFVLFKTTAKAAFLTSHTKPPQRRVQKTTAALRLRA